MLLLQPVVQLPLHVGGEIPSRVFFGFRKQSGSSRESQRGMFHDIMDLGEHAQVFVLVLALGYLAARATPSSRSSRGAQQVWLVLCPAGFLVCQHDGHPPDLFCTQGRRFTR